MRRRTKILVACFIGFLVYSGLIEPYIVRVTERDVTIEGLGGDEITIVHIADLHTVRYGIRENEVVEIVSEVDPDYVFVTGDLLKDDRDIATCLRVLNDLKARQGVYVVLGNADLSLLKEIDEGGVRKQAGRYTFLINESVDCGRFYLVGLDDPVTHREDMDLAFKNVGNEKPILVLTHFHPDSLLWELEERRVAMVFSGHTHGGQVGIRQLVHVFPFIYRSRYMAGLYRPDHFYLSVTRGIGTNVFPLRFLCSPEVCIYHLRR